LFVFLLVDNCLIASQVEDCTDERNPDYTPRDSHVPLVSEERCYSDSEWNHTTAVEEDHVDNKSRPDNNVQHDVTDAAEEATVAAAATAITAAIESMSAAIQTAIQSAAASALSVRSSQVKTRQLRTWGGSAPEGSDLAGSDLIRTDPAEDLSEPRGRVNGTAARKDKTRYRKMTMEIFEVQRVNNLRHTDPDKWRGESLGKHAVESTDEENGRVGHAQNGNESYNEKSFDEFKEAAVTNKDERVVLAVRGGRSRKRQIYNKSEKQKDDTSNNSDSVIRLFMNEVVPSFKKSGMRGPRENGGISTRVRVLMERELRQSHVTDLEISESIVKQLAEENGGMELFCIVHDVIASKSSQSMGSARGTFVETARVNGKCCALFYCDRTVSRSITCYRTVSRSISC